MDSQAEFPSHNGLTITELRFYQHTNDARVKAVVAITFNNCFVIRDIRIILREVGGYVISMPSRKSPNGQTYHDMCHPIDNKTRQWITDALLSTYLSDMASEEEKKSYNEFIQLFNNYQGDAVA